MDKAKANLKKSSNNREVQLLAEQTTKEFERQLEIVKTELGKIKEFESDHAGFLYNFLESYKIYNRRVAEIFEKIGANKW